MNSLKRLTVDIPVQLHRKLKIESFKSDTALREILINLLDSHFKKPKKKTEDPNDMGNQVTSE